MLNGHEKEASGCKWKAHEKSLTFDLISLGKFFLLKAIWSVKNICRGKWTSKRHYGFELYFSIADNWLRHY